MVTLQILVLPFLVRVRVAQQRKGIHRKMDPFLFTGTRTVNAPMVRLIATESLVNVAEPRLKVNDNDNEDDNEDENLNELSLTPHQAKPINLSPCDN